MCSRPARLWARARPLTRSRGSGCPSPSALSRAERSAASTAQRARVSAGGGTACQRGKGGRCKDMHFARRRGRGGDAGCGWAGRAPPVQERNRLGEVGRSRRRDGARRRAGQGRAGMRCYAGRGVALRQCAVDRKGASERARLGSDRARLGGEPRRSENTHRHPLRGRSRRSRRRASRAAGLPARQGRALDDIMIY